MPFFRKMNQINEGKFLLVKKKIGYLKNFGKIPSCSKHLAGVIGYIITITIINHFQC